MKFNDEFVEVNGCRTHLRRGDSGPDKPSPASRLMEGAGIAGAVVVGGAVVGSAVGPAVGEVVGVTGPLGVELAAASTMRRTRPIVHSAPPIPPDFTIAITTASRHQAVTSSTAAQAIAVVPRCVRAIPRSARMRAFPTRPTLTR